MCASSQSAGSLPQGFSIFQPALGAQLQFFPAVGTQELDDLLNHYLPGPAPIKEKRATVVLDFLEHAQLTGQLFKFYTVYAVSSIVASPAPSASSSFNLSPVNQTWDWSQTSRAASVSSRSSTHRVGKATGSSSSRNRATDFSHLPGMKIMTKDGQDVTNSASRGSKTKEQRDHAHLMRIIKACDSCRRKKIRCDPSHKKRGASQAQPQAQAQAQTPASSKPSSKPCSTRVLPPTPQSVSPPTLEDDFGLLSSDSLDLDASFSFNDMDMFASADMTADTWDEFVQFPAADFSVEGLAFADLDNYLSSQPSAFDYSASSSASPTNMAVDATYGSNKLAEPLVTHSPQPQPQHNVASPGTYADFNLFSPGSSFSEDEHMIELSSSSSSLTGLTPASQDGVLPTTLQTQTTADLASERHGPDTATQNLSGALGGTLDPGYSRMGGLSNQLATNRRSDQPGPASQDVIVSTNANGQLLVSCPPGTIIVAQPSTSAAAQQNASTSNMGITPAQSPSLPDSRTLATAVTNDVFDAAQALPATSRSWTDIQPVTVNSEALRHTGDTTDITDGRVLGAQPLSLATPGFSAHIGSQTSSTSSSPPSVYTWQGVHDVAESPGAFLASDTVSSTPAQLSGIPGRADAIASPSQTLQSRASPASIVTDQSGTEGGSLYIDSSLPQADFADASPSPIESGQSAPQLLAGVDTSTVAPLSSLATNRCDESVDVDTPTPTVDQTVCLREANASTQSELALIMSSVVNQVLATLVLGALRSSLTNSTDTVRCQATESYPFMDYHQSLTDSMARVSVSVA